MTSRREMFRRSASLGLLALGARAPHLWAGAAEAAGPGADAPVLVVLELTGGNDGLNTVVPFTDDVYHRSRPTLRVGPKEVLRLDDRAGFHPAMKGLKAEWDAGRVAVVQGVGYPGPSRSHFRSMDVWQSGSPGETPTSGWLASAADRAAGFELCHVGDTALPLALRGRRVVAQSVSDPADLRLAPGATVPDTPPAHDPVLDAIRERYAAARGLATRLASLPAATPVAPDDVSAPLRDRLATVRALTRAGAPFRVYYTSQGGFDTHASQKYQHEQLLRGVSGAISSFLTGLRDDRLDDRVVILVFSEFGRRLDENASGGTDHGTAAPVLLAGTPVRGGVLGPPPDLTHLDQGDPQFTTDFRDVYATVLRRWLGVDPVPVLGRRDDALALFARA